MEGQIVRTIKDFLTTKDGELCVNQDEYLQVKNEIQCIQIKLYVRYKNVKYIKYSFDLQIFFIIGHTGY